MMLWVSLQFERFFKILNVNRASEVLGMNRYEFTIPFYLFFLVADGLLQFFCSNSFVTSS